MNIFNGWYICIAISFLISFLVFSLVSSTSHFYCLPTFETLSLFLCDINLSIVSFVVFPHGSYWFFEFSKWQQFSTPLSHPKNGCGNNDAYKSRLGTHNTHMGHVILIPRIFLSIKNTKLPLFGRGANF
jgi:hypothetical protein